VATISIRRSPKSAFAERPRNPQETIAPKISRNVNLGAAVDDVRSTAAMVRLGRGHQPDLADRGQDEEAARVVASGQGKDHDNFRVKRYIAKSTINPAITHCVRN